MVIFGVALSEFIGQVRKKIKERAFQVHGQRCEGVSQAIQSA